MARVGKHGPTALKATVSLISLILLAALVFHLDPPDRKLHVRINEICVHILRLPYYIPRRHERRGQWPIAPCLRVPKTSRSRKNSVNIQRSLRKTLFVYAECGPLTHRDNSLQSPRGHSKLCQSTIHHCPDRYWARRGFSHCDNFCHLAPLHQTIYQQNRTWS